MSGSLRQVLVASSCVLAAALVGGCSSKAEVKSRSTTVGQELQDLEDARAKGLLTEDEYRDKRDEIMDRD
jgi:hypothetical protein